MSRDPARAATQFFGGRACLDFANTLDWRTSTEPQELIPDYAALIAWSCRRRTLTAQVAKSLNARAKVDSGEADLVMGETRLLRAEIWKIADALRANSPADLIAVNKMIANLPSQPQLLNRGGVYTHAFKGLELREPLWPVLWSLTAMLTSSDATRLGCCQATGCGWFYVDESPNRTRLWCSSEVCGNRERARRAYAKRNSKSSCSPTER